MSWAMNLKSSVETTHWILVWEDPISLLDWLVNQVIAFQRERKGADKPWKLPTLQDRLSTAIILNSNVRSRLPLKLDLYDLFRLYTAENKFVVFYLAQGVRKRSLFWVFSYQSSLTIPNYTSDQSSCFALSNGIQDGYGVLLFQFLLSRTLLIVAYSGSVFLVKILLCYIEKATNHTE
jgi:hypothetical protein